MRDMYTAELFCEDLVREILVNLPVKTLIRFKQVSRTWLYIITSHEFTKRHYYRSVANSQSPGNKNPKSFFLLRVLDDGWPDIRFITSLSLTNDIQECTIHENIFSPYLENMCTCNCFSSPLSSVGLGLYIVKFRRTSGIALWNPATREIKVLPPSPFYEFGKHYGCFSFGQAEIKDNTNTFSYKVGFIISKSEDWPCFKLVLYNSSTNSWKALSCDLGYDRSCYDADGINLKSKVHLLSVIEFSDAAYIITFDYDSEVFGRMEAPALPQITGRYYDIDRSFLTLYDDRFLCLVVFWKSQHYGFFVPNDDQEGLDTMFFDVWVMREYGVTESWVKECTIGPFGDNLIMQNYGKSTGGVFFELHDNGSRIYLSSCASSAITNNILVNSDRQESMFVLERMESLVAINGTSDETQTQKLWTEFTSHLDNQFQIGIEFASSGHPASNRVSYLSNR